MRKFLSILLTAIIGLSMTTNNNNIYDYSFKSLDGEDVSFSSFKGKKILIVNTASECGFTPQYEELQKLHEQYKDQLVIIGFPANEFGKQEPGSNSEIKGFCQKNYGVTFLMAEKTVVKGDGISPLFKYLTTAENPSFTGDIKWNFEKFLIDENGKLIARYRSMTKPLSSKITEKI